MEQTTLENKINILSELWMNYRDESEFQDFIEYNDIGLPLSYAISSGIVKTTDRANSFINETFDLLLAGLGVEDQGFESLDEILGV